MSQLPAFNSFLSTHTFGREHLSPPPLPLHMQVGQEVQSMQMGGSTSQNGQMHAGSLPLDFDNIVRSVGEW
jgi:hypothetical protein